LAICHGSGDGGAKASTAAIVPPAVTGNAAPTISSAGNEVVRAGSNYSFQPVASDADGDPVTFTATNLPTWASFDPQTGRIHGTPATTDVGAYDSVSITVADASHHVSTQDFTITVNGPSTGVASLSWPRPVSKFDGSTLDDLAGFRILYGRDPEDLDHSVFIANPDTLSYDFVTLESGAWYFAIVSVNAEGLEGPASVAAMKVI
jgi:hypothetical protein